MKYAVIDYPHSVNIGDEIQSIASANLLPKVDHYLPREDLDKVQLDEVTKLICNGYFMYQPQNWPPSDSIIPLFISLHVAKMYNADQYMMASKLNDYYAKYGPIGCRDKDTMRRYQANGFAAYFSACITLTLGSLFPNLERTDNIYLVDPFVKIKEPKYIEKALEHIVPVAYRDKVEVITHIHEGTISREEKIKKAKKLLKKYASAKLVITSRIHCALPCLAFGTPVYFVDAGYSRKNARERFDGVLDLMHKIDDRHFPFSSSSRIHKLIRKTIPADLLPWSRQKAIDFINWENPASNPVDINPIKDNIIQKVKAFIES